MRLSLMHVFSSGQYPSLSQNWHLPLFCLKVLIWKYLDFWPDPTLSRLPNFASLFIGIMCKYMSNSCENKSILLCLQITQYSCSYDNLAPAGCTQYFFGGNTGILKSFNYAGGAHLANQEQKICVR